MNPYIKNLLLCKKTVSLLVLISFICVTMCACQRNPSEPIIVSKNDGKFNEIIQNTAATKEPATTTNSMPFSFSDTFVSTDNSVEFNLDLNLNETVVPHTMPVVEVVPHYITAAEAQHVASVLFGDVDFFEADPMLAPQYTKGEILECIQRWSQYTNREAISVLLGQEDTHTIEVLKKRIEELNARYEAAPEDGDRLHCQWAFQKDSIYTYSYDEAAKRDQSHDNDAIMATCKINDIQYRFEAVTRNKEDYKLNVLKAYLDSSKSPLSIDANIYRASLTRTDPPTQEQIAAVKQKAMDMLQKMDLGEWEIDQCKIRTLGESILEHAICIHAVPVINNVAAAYQPQITGLSANNYSSNYYMTEVNFEFSANGDLILFIMYSPIDVKHVINKNVSTMDINTLLAKAKEHLVLSDSHQYGIIDVSGILKEDMDTSVDISEMRYGLLREKVPDTDDSYYYSPGIILYGTVENIGSESKQLYFRSDAPYPLIALNAVDGSVIF